MKYENVENWRPQNLVDGSSPVFRTSTPLGTFYKAGEGVIVATLNLPEFEVTQKTSELAVVPRILINEEIPCRVLVPVNSGVSKANVARVIRDLGEDERIYDLASKIAVYESHNEQGALVDVFA